MSRKMIPVEESFAAWRKDPEYEKAYNALEDKFTLAAAMIVDAIARAMRAEPAIFALVVDVKDDTPLRFYQHLGFQRFASHPMRLYLPVAEAARRLAERT